ncbi:MAG TPA: tetratricopeptide repeat protein, partial [Polyangiaceae bacterium]|nr:tetratricopeptide repeat protein [Polyangiaceae bacterium]
MSRLTRRLPGPLFASLALLFATAAGADSVSDVRARAKAAILPADAVDASRALRRAGLQTEAITTIQRAFGKARGDDALGDLHLELARSYIDQRQQKKALRECDQLHKLSPYKEQICQAEAQLLTRRGSAALPAAEQALAINAGDYDALVAKGRALTQLGKPSDAETVLSDARKRAPNRPEA